MTKQALRDELLEQLRADLLVLERAQAAAREGATHEEAKPENDKDTRALEASYLARGQALRIDELRGGIADVEAMRLRDFAPDAPIALGALVHTDEDGARQRFFVAPHGGGKRLGDGTVQVITPQSPLGRAMLGRRQGEPCEVVVGGKPRELVIDHVA